jgi:hypothetical protein
MLGESKADSAPVPQNSSVKGAALPRNQIMPLSHRRSGISILADISAIRHVNAVSTKWVTPSVV